MLWCACKMGDFGTVVVVGIKMAELPSQNSACCSENSWDRKDQSGRS